MHGANRLGGNSLSDLLVFGRRAGIGAVEFASGRTGPVQVDDGQVEAAIDGGHGPFERRGGREPLRRPPRPPVDHAEPGRHHPHRRRARGSLGELDELEDAGPAGSPVSGGRRYNPGWNLTTDLPAMLTVSRCTTLGAINRTESRGGHTRDDYPKPDRRDGHGQLRRAHPRRQGDATAPGGPPRSGTSTSHRSRSRRCPTISRNCWRRRPDGHEDGAEVTPGRRSRAPRRHGRPCGCGGATTPGATSPST